MSFLQYVLSVFGGRIKRTFEEGAEVIEHETWVIKVAAVTPDIRVADVAYNQEQIIEK